MCGMKDWRLAYSKVGFTLAVVLYSVACATWVETASDYDGTLAYLTLGVPCAFLYWTAATHIAFRRARAAPAKVAQEERGPQPV